ncbi:hypothetical protein PPTG_16807 [Phytophthora nicotianae INRA-310]|uniref:Uncharacterized protein n=1 Tax=Phytophthora nicotianae (strain INRA-310) TaxID=761204 RepID=W2PNG9_PHYN3|nr:hypothetical protein PPTG_16807 [Phytophthora nicotianae INRA-310]ETN02176.1 hypothetical protein PPTG_16807 [Phytophthora nicotianae INRA-310]
MTGLANIVVAGEGSIVQTLFTIQQLWPSMNEAQQMCEHLYSLLKKIVYNNLKNANNVVDSTDSDARTKFVAALTTFVKFLKLYSKKELLF